MKKGRAKKTTSTIKNNEENRTLEKLDKNKVKTGVVLYKFFIQIFIEINADSQVVIVVKSQLVNAEDIRNVDSTPESGRSSGI